MHGRLGALALLVGLSSLPLQASPTHAEGCELIGTLGTMQVKEGSNNNRAWRVIIEGVTYTSDRFDGFKKENRSKTTTTTSKSAKKKKVTTTATYFTFKDKTVITRIPNDGESKQVDAVLSGEINEPERSGFFILKDKSNGKEFRVDDGSQGDVITC